MLNSKINKKSFLVSIRSFLMLLLCFALVFASCDVAVAKGKQSKSSKSAKQAKKSSSAKSKSSKGKKSKGSSKKESKESKKSKKKKKSRVRAEKPIKVNYNVSHVLVDSALADGIHYKLYSIGTEKAHHNVHVLEVDITNPENSVEVLKSCGRANELEKLQDIVRRFDSTESYNVLGAINGNFWRAFPSFPIGPTIVEGEPVELNTHRNWSSAFFDEDEKLFIDNFKLSAFLTGPKGRVLPIDRSNRRLDSRETILYNHYYGDHIPYVPKQNLDALIAEALKDTTFADTTDSEIDTAQIRLEVEQAEHSAYSEYSMKKAIFEYLERPMVNKPTACRLVSVDTGTVRVPLSGFVVSFGVNPPDLSGLKPGEIYRLNIETSSHRDVHFLNSVSGTPRLVRRGVASAEARQEGSRSRRFISSPLPRTAIGTDKSQSKIYLATVEISNNKAGRTGANLEQMACIMEAIGCYNAMNLDGGGSTSMVLGGKNLIWKSNPDSSRKMAVGVAAARKKPSLKNVFQNKGSQDKGTKSAR